MASKMRAIVFDLPGDPNVLRLGEAARPDLKPNDVRVKVASTAVNRADVMQRQGTYPPPPGASNLLGLECAGEIIELGPEVKKWKVGDRVMALLAGGGYAEEVAADAGSIMPVPDGLPDNAAGAVPETFLTAYLNVFQLGKAEKGDWVLVHGGGSGLGTSAITLCKQAGVKIIVTAGSAKKLEQCAKHGATHTINYKEEDWVARVKELTNGEGVAMVLDSIGAPYFAKNLDCLALDGRLVIIGWLGGTKLDSLDLNVILKKRLHIIGSTLRSRSEAFKAQLVSHFLEKFGPGIADGSIRPVIEKVYPLKDAAKAHADMEASAHFGKLVLQVAGGVSS